MCTCERERSLGFSGRDRTEGPLVEEKGKGPRGQKKELNERVNERVVLLRDFAL